MCPQLTCVQSAGPRRRAVLFYVAAWLGWLLGGFEFGLMLVYDEPYLSFLNTPEERRQLVLAALLAAHAAAAGLAGLAVGLWADSVVETRSLVIMAALPQLLGATLSFFAATLGELIMARLLSGLGAGAAVAILCELLRVTPARLRVAALAGLAISRELGADVGPTVAQLLDRFPELPSDVVRHRATPWNAAGLLLLVCHLVYLLVLLVLYPDVTVQREAQLHRLRRLMYADETDADAAETDNPYATLTSDDDAPPDRYAQDAEAQLHALAVQFYEDDELSMEECCVGEEPAAEPRPPPTPSPAPGLPRTESDLAEIGYEFAHPDDPDGPAAQCRPLEGPYADAPEGEPGAVLARLVYAMQRSGERRSTLAHRLMRRMMRSWLRCASALSALLPHEEELGPVGVTPRWMLGMSAVMRLLTSGGLVLTVLLSDPLAAVSVASALAVMAAAHLGLGLALARLHAHRLDWDAPVPPSDMHLAWVWVLRVTLCAQGVAMALFEPVALSFFSQMVPKIRMGRGVSFWALATRFGVITGHFWTLPLSASLSEPTSGRANFLSPPSATDHRNRADLTRAMNIQTGLAMGDPSAGRMASQWTASGTQEHWTMDDP
ncbi:hypothetical protein FJT64_008986 [Amphibalanus amphitrite]|uniref:Uncharacterized protein n=1 Tax=Amphibalanus amphitrite TaxID=1232801 RepID=A0A6A4VF47_AMPAM|nr:hypothetical protein FJT64_008986 [Amphibalanus amphitrite]